jgi:carbon storage regulator
MLVLSRERNESIVVGDNIVVTVVDIRGQAVRIGIAAPRELPIHRQEVYERLRRLNRAAAAVAEDPSSNGAERVI